MARKFRRGLFGGNTYGGSTRNAEARLVGQAGETRSAEIAPVTVDRHVQQMAPWLAVTGLASLLQAGGGYRRLEEEEDASRNGATAQRGTAG